AADGLAVVESRHPKRLLAGEVEQGQVVLVGLLALELVIAVVEDEDPGPFRRLLPRSESGYDQDGQKQEARPDGPPAPRTRPPRSPAGPARCNARVAYLQPIPRTIVADAVPSLCWP